MFIYASYRAIVTGMFLEVPRITCPSPVVYGCCARW